MTVRGFANLPVLLALTALLMVIGTAIAALTINELFDTQDVRYSREAIRYAESGAKDALLKVTRNKTYSCASGPLCPYTIEFVEDGCGAPKTGCATVSVSSGVGSAVDPKIITSTGLSGEAIRKVQVTVIFDASLNGEITSAVWTEVAP